MRAQQLYRWLCLIFKLLKTSLIVALIKISAFF